MYLQCFLEPKIKSNNTDRQKQTNKIRVYRKGDVGYNDMADMPLR